MSFLARLRRAITAARTEFKAPLAGDVELTFNPEAVNDRLLPPTEEHALPAGFRRGRVRKAVAKRVHKVGPVKDYKTFHFYAPVRTAENAIEAHTYLRYHAKSELLWLSYANMLYTDAGIHARLIWWRMQRNDERYRKVGPNSTLGCEHHIYWFGHEPVVAAKEYGEQSWLFVTRLQLAHPLYKLVETVELTPDIALAVGDKQLVGEK